MAKVWLIAMVLVTAGYTLLAQVLPLLVLDAKSYGFYSIVYLLFVLGASLSLSFISEAEVRSIRDSGSRASWGDYSSVSLLLALMLGGVAFAVCLVTPPLHASAASAAVAVGASTYLAPIRFRMVQEGKLWKVVLADLLGAAGVVSSALWIYAYVGVEWRVEQAILVWAASSLLRLVLIGLPAMPTWTRLMRWKSSHGRQAAVLLPDSILQDAGSLWAPYLLAVLLDIASLGVYRAVATMAAPVRLAVAPLRPLIAKVGLVRTRSWRYLGVVALMGVSLGVGAGLFLVALEYWRIEIGVLGALFPLVIPVALFVFGNAMGQVYSIMARTNLPRRALLFGRAAQAALLGVLPLVAAWLWGLEGAVWALGVANSGLGFVWFALLRWPRAQARPSA